MPVLISRGNGSNHTSVRAFSLVPACCCHMNKLPGRQAARILYRAAYVSSVALCALSTEPSAKLGTQGNGVVPGAWLELEDLGEAAIVEPHLPLAPPRPLPRLLHLDLSSCLVNHVRSDHVRARIQIEIGIVLLVVGLRLLLHHCATTSAKIWKRGIADGTRAGEESEEEEEKALVPVLP